MNKLRTVLFSIFKSKFQVIHATNSDFDSWLWCEFDCWSGYGLEAGLCLMIDGCVCILTQFLSHYLAAWIVTYFAFKLIFGVGNLTRFSSGM